MAPASTDRERASLVATLREVVAHLRGHDEPSWADEVDQCRWRVEDGDPNGIARFLRATDGSGGLADLTLRVPQREESHPDAQAANDHLRSLLARASNSAEALRVAAGS
ncbi:MAG: hypothetical protein ACT4QF_11565 [Sporichthyaceae bacterium]